MLGAEDQLKAVDTTIPSTSPIAQPVRQCRVALTAVLLREFSISVYYYGFWKIRRPVLIARLWRNT